MRTIARIVGVLVTACLVAVILLGAAAVMGWRLPFQKETIDRSQPAVLTSIQDVSRFDAAVGNFEVVLDYEDDVSWVPDFIAGERSLFVAAGTVDAYVDFSGLAAGDLEVSSDGTTVRIDLPDAELGEPNLDQDRTYLFSQKRGVINRFEALLSTQDQQELYQRSEEKLATAAEESALRAQAEENTRAMLVGLFDSLDMSVEFADG